MEVLNNVYNFLAGGYWDLNLIWIFLGNVFWIISSIIYIAYGFTQEGLRGEHDMWSIINIVVGGILPFLTIGIIGWFTIIVTLRYILIKKLNLIYKFRKWRSYRSPLQLYKGGLK